MKLDAYAMFEHEQELKNGKLLAGSRVSGPLVETVEKKLG